MRELHLFAGAGGGILGGLLLGHRCIGAVEIDPYCRQVLLERQQDGSLPEFPIHDDIRTFDARPWRGRIDVVCGGFPCQPWSVAGKQRGKDDPRHLWPEMARVVAECRPTWVFAENVALSAFEEPWRDLRGLGYRVPPALCLGADDVGAPHRRKRWWMLARDADGHDAAQVGSVRPRRGLRSDAEPSRGCGDVPDAEDDGRPSRAGGHRHQRQDVSAESTSRRGAARGGCEPGRRGCDVPDADRIRAGQPGRRHGQGRAGAAIAADDGEARALADADRTRLEVGTRQRGDDGEELAAVVEGCLGDANGGGELQQGGGIREERRRLTDPGWWATEPDVGRVAHGVAARVDRLRALGNGQVPACAAVAWQTLIELHYR